jgi:hypothetical protein
MTSLSALALLLEPLGGFQGGGELIRALHGAARASREFGGKAIGGLGQFAGRAIGVARRADDEDIRLIALQQALDCRPVDAVVVDRDRGAGSGGRADRIARGNTMRRRPKSKASMTWARASGMARCEADA